MDERQGVNCYVHYHEYDFALQRPTLVIQGEFGSIGYDLNPDTGDLTRTCICYAYVPSECSCGYCWGSSEEDYYDD